MKIRINTHGNPLPEQHGDWIDLKAAETVNLNAWEDYFISLGISMEIPDGYEAHLVPRSSTFKRHGILLVNGMGIIDNDYAGDNDVWQFHALACRDTTINKGDRIAQFRIMPKQPDIEFDSVQTLCNPDRGGFGSTGV